MKFLLHCQEKAFVFVDFEESFEEMEGFLKKEGVSFVKLDEKQSFLTLKENLSIFQENFLYKIALVSYKVLPQFPSSNIKGNISHIVFAEVIFFKKINEKFPLQFQEI